MIINEHTDPITGETYKTIHGCRIHYSEKECEGTRHVITSIFDAELKCCTKAAEKLPADKWIMPTCVIERELAG